jgi:predicted nucleic acid-binding protein
VIVLDASVLIGHLSLGDAHHGRATELLTSLAAERFGASPTTLAEVLVAPTRLGKLAAAQRALHDLGVESLELGSGSATRLAAFRVETGLRMPDCCVLLAAENHHADLATFDGRLAATATARGLVVHG